MNSLENYDKLLDKENIDDNFFESLKFSKNATIFNNILNQCNINKIDYKIIKGFNYLSDDNLIKTFSKITIQINNKTDLFETLIKDVCKYKITNNLYELVI